MNKSLTGVVAPVGHLYGGFEPADGDCKAAQADIEAWHASRAPKPIDQIRAKEQAQNVRDAMERANRLASFVVARTELVRQQGTRVPPAVVTHDQAHTFLYTFDAAYKLLWDVEQEIAQLRKQAP